MRRGKFWMLVVILLAQVFSGFSTAKAVDEFEPGDVVEVATTSMILRAEPSVDSLIIATLSQGTELTVTSEPPVQDGSNTWWYLESTELQVEGWGMQNLLQSTGTTTSTAESCWQTSSIADPIAGVRQWSSPPEMQIDSAATYIATIATSAGEILIELHAAEAPEAVNNFVCLAEIGFYDLSTFHRVVSGLFVQGGDPTGSGESGPGYEFAAESDIDGYPAGSVALANKGPGTNGSQFFIAADDLTELIPDTFPVFGLVISGMDVVEAIGQVELEANARGEQSSPSAEVTVFEVSISQPGTQIGPVIDTSGQDNPNTFDETGDANQNLTVNAVDIAFKPDELTVPAGELVQIEIVNEGAAPHNYTIDSLGISIDLAPGETGTYAWSFQPGTYDFYCNVPGHTEAGQFGVIHATDDTGANIPGTSAIDSDEGCSGLDAYTVAYDQAIVAAVLASPEAMTIYLETDPALSDEELFLSLTDEQMIVMAEMFANMALGLVQVVPPAFLTDWHAAEVEMMQAFSDFLSAVANEGIMMAGILHADAIEQSEQRTNDALLVASAICPDFADWAATESLSGGMTTE